MANGTARAYQDRTNLSLYDEGDRLSEIAQKTGRSKSFIVRVLIRSVDAALMADINSTMSEWREGIKKAIEEERRR